MLLALLLLTLREPARGESDGLETHGQEGELAAGKPSARDVFRLFALPNYLLLTLGYVAYTFSLGAFPTWTAKFLHGSHGMEVHAADTYFGYILAGTGLVSTLIGGLIATAWHKRYKGAYSLLLALSAAGAVPISFCAFLVGSTLGSFVCLTLAMFLLFLPTGPVGTLTLETVPRRTARQCNGCLDLCDSPARGFLESRSGWLASRSAGTIVRRSWRFTKGAVVAADSLRDLRRFLGLAGLAAARRATDRDAGSLIFLRSAMRVLVAPDKFKGSLTAREAADAMAAGWLDARPGDDVIRRPIADGGEGSAEAVCDALGGRWVECSAHDPLGRSIRARYAVVTSPESGGETTAFVECSAASGYSLVRPGERDLAHSSTYGTGELLAHAFVESRADRIIVGLGGSATNDGGSGLAAALGYRFLDADGKSLAPCPASLEHLATIVPPADSPWSRCSLVAACDVQNPLLGRRGASAVYGPQKGLPPGSEMVFDDWLHRLADVAAVSLGTDFSRYSWSWRGRWTRIWAADFLRGAAGTRFWLNRAFTGSGSRSNQSGSGRHRRRLGGRTKSGRKSTARRGHAGETRGQNLGPHRRPRVGMPPDPACADISTRLYALTDSGRPADECIRQAAGLLRELARTAAIGVSL